MTRIGRLKRRAEFLAAAAANRKWVAPGLVLQARALGTDDPFASHRADSIHVGFTASRKVGNAVARNRAKRRLRAIAAEILKAEISKGAAAPAVPTDLVLIARPATITRDFQSLRQDFTRGLQKLGVMAKAEKAR